MRQMKAEMIMRLSRLDRARARERKGLLGSPFSPFFFFSHSRIHPSIFLPFSHTHTYTRTRTLTSHAQSSTFSLLHIPFLALRCFHFPSSCRQTIPKKDQHRPALTKTTQGDARTIHMNVRSWRGCSRATTRQCSSSSSCCRTGSCPRLISI